MFSKLNFAPGVTRESTQTTSPGTWYYSKDVRFRGGYPESIGGWERDSDYEVDGIIRDMFSWTDYSGVRFFGIATDWRVYVVGGGGAVNITPIRKETLGFVRTGLDTMLDPSFGGTVSLTGSFIQIDDVQHGVVLDDFVRFSNFSGTWNQGGVTDVQAALEDTDFQVVYVVDADKFLINAPSAVSDEGGSSSATFDIHYEENVGLSVASSGVGWGAGTYGTGIGWGEAASVTVSTGDARFTFLDNYNEDLLYSTSGGPIFFWDTSENSTGGNPIPGLNNRMVKLGSLSGSSDPPEVCNSFMVSERDGHVIAFGCNDLGLATQNSLLIRWSDQNNQFVWVPETTNTAGGQMLRLGSRIVGAVSTQGGILVFTDAGIYLMNFVGPPDVFAFSLITDGVELMTQRSAVDVANVVYFMGADRFYAFTGSVSPLECPLEKYIFEDFNRSASSKVFCGLNYDYGEILWFYPSKDSWEPDRYVAFNYKDHTWYSGSYDMSPIARSGTFDSTYNRTAWLDSRTRAQALSGYLLEYDTSASPNVKRSAVMIQERGRTTPNGDLECILESSFTDIEDGGKMSFVSRLIPDFEFFNLEEGVETVFVEASLQSKDFPGSEQDLSGSGFTTQMIEYDNIGGTFSPTGNSTAVRMRGRMVSIKYRTIESSCAGGWRLGATRIDVIPDGRR